MKKILTKNQKGFACLLLGIIISGGVFATCPTITVTPSASPKPVLCVGNTLTLSASASGGSSPYSYSWKSPDNTVIATTASTSLTVSAGSYNVTVTDANGCTGTAQINITVNSNPVMIVVASPHTIICQYNDLTLVGNLNNGGSGVITSYAWTGPNGFSSSAASPLITANSTAAAGVYTLTATDNNGCKGTAESNPVTIIPNDADDISVSPAAVTISGGSSATLAASSAVSTRTPTYLWSPASGLSATAGASVTASPAGTTTYTVKGYTGPYGCYKSATSTVTVTYAVAAAVTSGLGSISPSGTTAVPAGSNQTYTFTGYVQNVVVDGTSVGSASTYTFNNVQAPHTIAVAFGTSDISCTSGGSGIHKTQMCKNGKTLCVDDNAVAGQLNSGSTLGPCSGSKHGNQALSVIAEFKISPNPTYGIINVAVPTSENEAQVVITDMAGRTVATRTVTANTTAAVEFNVAGVPAGMYIVKVNVNGTIYTDKFSKN